MKCQLLLLFVLVICAEAAPFMQMTDQQINPMMANQQLDQSTMNQIAQQSMERWILQNQYNSMQQQLIAMQQLQGLQKNPVHGPMPILFNLPSQPLIMLMPNTIIKTHNQFGDVDENDPANLKLGIEDAETVIIDAENESNVPEMGIIPRRAVVVLPNGQRLIIGSIISAIPFLPFEVNVPDTIAWIYNGIAGIIGGIGQRLPFRPKPTTEASVQQTQETMTSSQESISQVQGSMMRPQEMPISGQDSRLKLIQKLITRKQNVGMPILMLPL